MSLVRTAAMIGRPTVASPRSTAVCGTVLQILRRWATNVMDEDLRFRSKLTIHANGCCVFDRFTRGHIRRFIGAS